MPSTSMRQRRLTKSAGGRFRPVLQLLAPAPILFAALTLTCIPQKEQLVLDLVKKVGGTSYISGGPGFSYLPLERFRQEGVDVVAQAWKAPTARRGLADPSILDLLANEGVSAAREISVRGFLGSECRLTAAYRLRSLTRGRNWATRSRVPSWRRWSFLGRGRRRGSQAIGKRS